MIFNAAEHIPIVLDEDSFIRCFSLFTSASLISKKFAKKVEKEYSKEKDFFNKYYTIDNNDLKYMERCLDREYVNKSNNNLIPVNVSDIDDYFHTRLRFKAVSNRLKSNSISDKFAEYEKPDFYAILFLPYLYAVMDKLYDKSVKFYQFTISNKFIVAVILDEKMIYDVYYLASANNFNYEAELYYIMNNKFKDKFKKK